MKVIKMYSLPSGVGQFLPVFQLNNTDSKHCQKQCTIYVNLSVARNLKDVKCDVKAPALSGARH